MAVFQNLHFMGQALYIDCYIIDGIFFLHLLGELPLTFGKMSRTIFYQVVNSSTCNRIDHVFDRYIMSSIKNYTRDVRSDGNSSSPYVISGPHQRRPNGFIKSLRNDHFKMTLIHYLVDSWNDDILAHTLDAKTMFVTCEEKYYSFKNENGRGVRREEVNMVNFAEETDTRMIYHAACLPSPVNVVLRTYDTDVLCIAIGVRKQLQIEHNIWLEVGHYTNNSSLH